MDHAIGRRRRIGILILAAAAALFIPITDGGFSRASGASAKARPEPHCDRTQFRIVVDVGHSLEAPGATSARGISEYEYNLRLATQIEQALLDIGFGQTTLLVTDGPALPGLFKRVNQARALDAQLFLSIHHDSVPESFLKLWDVDGVERHFSDAFKGHSIFVSNDSPEYQGSLRFGRMLGTHMKARGLQYTPHYTEAIMGKRRRQLVDAEAGVYRYDQLIVLRHARMPAVLLEAGSIINRDEELESGSSERRASITAAVTSAVEEFCAYTPKMVAKPAPQMRVPKPRGVRQASARSQSHR